MAKRLSDLSGWATKAEWPRVLCPDCLEGSLALESVSHILDPKSVAQLERYARNLEGRDEASGTFTGVLRCDNHVCKRGVVVAGTWGDWWDVDDDGRTLLVEHFHVGYMEPPARLLLTPKRTPSKVVDAIETASKVLWSSPDAAATHLRLAVEELLTSLHVKRFTLTRARKRRRLTTQERLDLLEATHPNLVHTLEAVKWIGNEGTHSSGLEVRDVEKGAKLLELALRDQYDTSEAELHATAKDINRRKGLPRAR
ncbi:MULTISPECIES: DUF4145 domain-containing protein [Microbacterium]|uniref:DUF4145 domain-containing protein n=1 Tax=Microbacterium saccharophilum TaxID=1213358 RepID=A0A7Z7CXN1_9MICO|nr:MULTISPECIES: DUF4145 domain-containing protein [Microbacterium]SFI21534.1 protein of unknown function [Microbacterium saccharophilum]